MKKVHYHRKYVSIFVMAAFTIMLCFWANQSPASEKNSRPSMASATEESPGFVEEEADSPAVKKGKKFPWLIVGAAVVIGAVAVYFLVRKKPKHTLTVSLSGATGTPAASEKYKKDTKVAYSYTAESGYINLEVKLDGVAVPASGSVTMDKDHTLTATAVQHAAITVNSTPAGAKIYMNNADSGFTTPHTFQYNSAVTKTVLLRSCGYLDYSKTVTANLGKTETIDQTLTAGILDNFMSPSACWVPDALPGSAWTLSSGIYKSVARVKGWSWTHYDTAFSSSTYTAEVKMKRVKGNAFNSNSIVLSTSTDMNAVSGYLFNYTASGYYSIWKYTNLNFTTGSGEVRHIKMWSYSTHIEKKLGSWNTLKVVRSGSNYTYFINNKLVYSFSNSSFDPRVLVMEFYSGNKETEMQYDFAKLTIGAAQGLVPGERVVALPVTDQKPSGYEQK